MTYSLLEIVLLFSAGVLGGALNSLAGGGSFIVFPVLVFVGIPPIVANATNTFASFPGYLSGAFAFKAELIANKKQLPKVIIISLLGGIIGAWALTQVTANSFEQSVPWLLLFATLLFILGGRLNALLKNHALKSRNATKVFNGCLFFLFFIICIYGGFFNAGLGIILLSYMALAGYQDIHLMNGLKLLTSSVVSIIAIVLFAFDDLIAWQAGIITLLGIVVGGYFAAKLSRHLPQQWLRNFVIVVSIATTAYFFYASY